MNKDSKRLPNEINLIRRYLTWCYKTTKEDLDRIDRYYTQDRADQFILDQLMKDPKFFKEDDAYQSLVRDFEKYMVTKKENVDKKKFKNIEKKVLDPNYKYLSNRFQAIEKAIQHFLGQKELAKITDLYEQEMTKRILEAKEHV